MDQAMEPVYEDDDGNFEVSQFNYEEARTDWQRHIDDTRYGGNLGPVTMHSKVATPEAGEAKDKPPPPQRPSGPNTGIDAYEY
ncbi:hypothetical protein FOA52_002480 [Chlamydomonas sp. UWO 241]|nr:hypothetical protein FOA52_002480 [Chlamydomonas sp. UWO 241]